MTTADYLNDLVKQRNRLAGLLARCTDATDAEKFNGLIDRLEQLIPQKGFMATKYDDSGYPTEGVIYGSTTVSQRFLQNRLKLESVTLPDGLTQIEIYAFMGCEALKSIVIPDSVTSISSGVFNGCKSLASVKISSNLNGINQQVFQGCESLTDVVIPASVASIATNAFNGCKKLTTVTFKGTPTSIHANAFAACTNVTAINVPWADGAVANAPWGAANATINYNYSEEASE